MRCGCASGPRTCGLPGRCTTLRSTLGSAATFEGEVASRTDIFDLGRLGLTSGEGRRLDLTVLIDPLEFGGQHYAAGPAEVPAKLDVSRTTGNGWFLRLRFEARLSGPCMRCLEDAGRRAAIAGDSRRGDQPGAEDDDLESPYVEGDEVDVHAWARDALVLELPTQIVCS